MVPVPSENSANGEGNRVKGPDLLSTETPGAFLTSKNVSKSRSSSVNLDVPSSRPSLDTLSGLSTHSLEEWSAIRPTARSLQDEQHVRVPSLSPVPPRSIAGRWRKFWERQKGMVYMVLSQFFGAAMATVARYMQTTDKNGKPMHTFQILFVRMGVTMVGCFAYMGWMKVPNAPLGKPELRKTLLARGFGGFFGIFGLYYSLAFLPLAEATVITFLAPILAAWACSILIKTPFTKSQRIAFFISLVGVIMIAKPLSFLKTGHSASGSNASGAEPTILSNTTTSNSTVVGEEAGNDNQEITPVQHVIAVGVGLIGVCGAATAYTTIQKIGAQAHPLIIINYFAVFCTILSTLALIFIPDVTFRLPADLNEWILMFFLGTSGFVMQFLLTAGLSHTKGGRGLNMVYTQMLFALAFDKIVWGTTPGIMSILGSSLIVGSAIWVAMKKEQTKETAPVDRSDEELGLVEGMDVGNESRDEATRSNEDIGHPRTRDMELRRMPA